MSQSRRRAGIMQAMDGGSGTTEELRAGESESLRFDALETKRPSNMTSTHGDDWKAFAERAKQEANRGN